VNKQYFEHVIKQDIRNNPIIREVDHARQKELWRSAAIGFLLVAVLLFSAWQHFELLQDGYRIEQMEYERAQELEINRHLRLEIETLRSPKRIERIATEQLNLVAPSGDESFVVERVVPVMDPDESIVATRRGEDISEVVVRP
jgi:cell division protein FtsL